MLYRRNEYVEIDASMSISVFLFISEKIGNKYSKR
ncbi:Uncharacterised protein [Staphylococcus microti]|uniref:Uncharacterized protein n=1 Tax=Staphylococcus microti TaxID=569857 RepID=A0A380GSM3_9STAP|nr:Uncharacterised protein [Staphylococcus microti]